MKVQLLHLYQMLQVINYQYFYWLSDKLKPIHSKQQDFADLMQCALFSVVNFFFFVRNAPYYLGYWCSNSVSKKWQDNFSGKYITTNEGNYWWLSIEAGSPIGTEERLHWGRNILPSSFHSFLSSYELGTFTSCFHLHIKFQQNPKVVLWRNTKPNTPPQRRASTS